MTGGRGLFFIGFLTERDVGGLFYSYGIKSPPGRSTIIKFHYEKAIAKGYREMFSFPEVW